MTDRLTNRPAGFIGKLLFLKKLIVDIAIPQEYFGNKFFEPKKNKTKELEYTKSATFY